MKLNNCGGGNIHRDFDLSRCKKITGLSSSSIRDAMNPTADNLATSRQSGQKRHLPAEFVNRYGVELICQTMLYCQYKCHNNNIYCRFLDKANEDAEADIRDLKRQLTAERRRHAVEAYFLADTF